jgi:AcrR family transcriptional regulator
MTVQSPSHDPAKRARLIASAAEAFSRVGFDRANVDEVAANAGVAKGTVYLYFANKGELFLAVLAELRDQTDLAHWSASGDDEPETMLRNFIRHQLKIAAASPDLFRCYTSALFGVNRDFQEMALSIFKSQRDRVAGQLRRLAGASRVTTGIERRASLFLTAILAAALVGGLETGRAARSTSLEEQALLAMAASP